MTQVTPGISRIWLGLALIIAPVLALLALETYVVVGSTPELRQNRELVARTFEFISTAQTLQRSIQDAERGQRGFLLTGDSDYLEPYSKSRDEIPTLLSKLKQLAASNVEHQRRIQELDRQIAIKLEELRRTLDVAATQGTAAAVRATHSNVGLVAMESITALIDGAVAGENFRLTDQLQDAADDERRAMRMGIVGAVLALLVIGLGAIVAWVALRRIIASEAARHESEERFRLLVDDVTDYGIYMLDPDGRVSTWNAGAQRIKGYTTDEIVGEHFSRFFTEDDRATGEPERVLSAARGGRYAGEHWRVRKNGERFFASVTVNPVRNATGTLIGFAKITRDIGDRLAQQQALEQARAELAQSQKMEALGQLSGGVAHDFNNVLHVINNAVTILMRHLGDTDPEVHKFLDMIKRNADRGASLTQRLLAFSRTQPLDPHIIDPNQLVSGLVDLLRQTLGTTIDIDTQLAEAVWQISADTNQLETAIINLAINARDAMPGGGALTIATTNVQLDAAYASTHPEVITGDHVLIAISDTGTGMPSEVLARALEPFYTTKSAGQGTGLGLSQVFGFIKQSGGHMTIDSAVGRGTRVKLCLPRYVATAADASSRSDATPVAFAAPPDSTRQYQ